MAPLLCPYCGLPGGTPCGRCSGAARTLRTRAGIAPGRSHAIVDLVRGAWEVPHATLALLHDPAFVGRLRLPAWSNALAVLGLAAITSVWLWPAFAAAFATPWWLLDGLRTATGSRGPVLWLCASWLVLGPPLLEATVGALHDGLLAAAERALLGARPIRARGTVHRLRDRARLLAVALLLWPAALLLVLVPWCGLPLVLLLGGAIAAVVWFEPVMARAGLDPRAQMALLWRNRWRALGTGLAAQFAVAVPFLNLLGLTGAATVAAASAFVAFDKALTAPEAR